ncbi:hypothetical protein GMJLKIPL_1865 [Methylobacterium isbiliense]|uniref:Uncharacterized protein n=1 Tax=Methylobacterium isbiliense TaxID=315478 RepID=A0ABQ4SDG2_9HYPH|nr:hypothetical protein GMJLKIPL_1865 [Methylobacterium isbiliense]
MLRRGLRPGTDQLLTHEHDSSVPFDDDAVALADNSISRAASASASPWATARVPAAAPAGHLRHVAARPSAANRTLPRSGKGRRSAPDRVRSVGSARTGQAARMLPLNMPPLKTAAPGSVVKSTRSTSAVAVTVAVSAPRWTLSPSRITTSAMRASPLKA